VKNSRSQAVQQGLSRSSGGPGRLIFEATAREILAKADQKRAASSRDVTSRLVKLKASRLPGTHLFYSSKSKGKPQTWLQVVRLNVREKQTLYGIRKAISSQDVHVYCNCPDFKFGGFAYLMTRERSALSGFEEPRFPKKSNPKALGSVCKHLVNVLRQLPGEAREIYNRLN